MAPVPGRVPLRQGIAVAAPCHHSKDHPAPGSRGRDQLRRGRPLSATGSSPCLSTDRVRIGPDIWFGLRPETNRVPWRARTLHGPGAVARAAASWHCRCGLLPSPLRIIRRRGADGGISCASPPFSPKVNTGSRSDFAFPMCKPTLKATVALPGTDVNLAGRAPARLAVHCILATGGPGAATPHAPFGRPRHPLGTFPCGKVPRPPAGGRNLPQETDFLWMARKSPTLLFL